MTLDIVLANIMALGLPFWLLVEEVLRVSRRRRKIRIAGPHPFSGIDRRGARRARIQRTCAS